MSTETIFLMPEKLFTERCKKKQVNSFAIIYYTYIYIRTYIFMYIRICQSRYRLHFPHETHAQHPHITLFCESIHELIG